MTPADRGALNRRAAELAGWTWRDNGLEVVIHTPAGEFWGYSSDGEHAPDFVGEPGLWWPLVERMARLSLERDDLEWEGPFLSTLSGCWRVEWQIGDRRWDAAEDEEPGAAVVRAALAVADALRLKG